MDEVVSAVQFEGRLFIFMRSGKVWEMYRNQITGDIQFRLHHNMIP